MKQFKIVIQNTENEQNAKNLDYGSLIERLILVKDTRKDLKTLNSRYIDRYELTIGQFTRSQ